MKTSKLVLALAVVACVVVEAAPSRAADAGAERDIVTSEPLPQRTLAAVPNGVDTYTAFLGQRGVGAAGVGVIESGTTKSDLSGGVRIWGGFLNRFTAVGDASRDQKGRFAPSVALGARLLGDRQTGWGLGALGRYRTEGLTTMDGEVEGGLMGSYAKRQLHLDLGLIAGVGVEEKEADGEVAFRFGYDVLDVLRLGVEGRVRRELGDEEAAPPAGVKQEEWDAFGGAQACVAFNHFFGTLTLGPQKLRTSEQVGFLAHLMLGGVAF